MFVQTFIKLSAAAERFMSYLAYREKETPSKTIQSVATARTLIMKQTISSVHGSVVKLMKYLRRIDVSLEIKLGLAMINVAIVGLTQTLADLSLN